MATTRNLARALFVLAALSALGGCAVWRGGRLYESGTRALDAGRIGRAVADLEQARELVPHASEVRNHLALAYLAQGRQTEALRELRSAVELDCGNDAARWNLRALEGSLGIDPTEEWPPRERRHGEGGPPAAGAAEGGSR